MNIKRSGVNKRRHPDWLKVEIPSGKEYHRIKSLLASSRLHTICKEAKCPNIAECFSKGTATFLILGDVCTRSCTYCNVKKGTPLKLDSGEPERAARLVNRIGISINRNSDRPLPFPARDPAKGGVPTGRGESRSGTAIGTIPDTNPAPLQKGAARREIVHERSECLSGKLNPVRDKMPTASAPPTVGISNGVNLNYVVITSVTRDDLSDGGAGIFAQTIQRVRKLSPRTKIEILIPDFKGNLDSLKKVIDVKPYVLAHNLETVERLFPTVRSQGNYRRSLNLLEEAKKITQNIFTKSGIMVGMGETKEEITEVMKDLREVECDIFTIGQYLQPSLNHLSISKYYTPEEFKEFQKIGEEMGFLHVESGPLVRSSYHAGELNHLPLRRW